MCMGDGQRRSAAGGKSAFEALEAVKATRIIVRQ